MKKDSQWDWWRAALAGADQPIHEDQPMSGFYRVRAKGGPFEPVAIWRDKNSNELRARRAGQSVDPHQIWTWACRNPVSHEEYKAVEAGGQWSDAPPPIAVAGHNLPADDAERLALLLKEETAAIAIWLNEGAIDNEDRAAAAAELTKRAIAFAKEAEDLRVKEKKPFMDQANAIQRKWAPIVGGFEDLNRKLKRALDDFLREKKRKLEEERRAQQEEQSGEDPFGLPPLPEKVSVGNVGATVSLRTYKVGRITDMAAFLAANAGNAAIIDAAQKVANALARAGATSPGMEIINEERAA